VTGISILGVSYAFPSTSRGVEELALDGRLRSEPERLKQAGFNRIHIAEQESPYELGLASAQAVLDESGVDPDDIGLVLYSGAAGETAFHPGNVTNIERSALRTADRNRFPATRLQFDLGLENASVIGVDQLGGTNLFGAIRVARSLCLTEGISHALCVSTDFMPTDSVRETIFTCTSDAACSVIVGQDRGRNRIVASRHVTKGFFWEADRLRDEILGAYFPNAQLIIGKTLDDAGWSADDVDWVIPHNVNLRSWELVLKLAGMRNARLWSRNVPRDGHTLADNFINLRDALESGSVRGGERVLLFGYGYGAHWTAIAMEA
jgi:3-oxoacyl-[acyl-carrier-protein] synthase III